MINHLLFLFFVINLVSPLFAADEVNILSLNPLGKYMQSSLPQLNIDYDALVPDINRSENLQPLLNFEIDDSAYCPHTEILAKVINELRNILPQGGDKIKDVLSNYYTILENALNSLHNVESRNMFSSKNVFNNIDSLAQKIITMNDKNLKIRISFEYELPTMDQKICEKLCKDIINFANAGTSAAINDSNYANGQSKMNNNIIDHLQHYRPDDSNANPPSYIKLMNQLPTMNKADYFYPPNLDFLPINQLAPQLGALNSLQSESHSLPSQKVDDPMQNFAPPLQDTKETDSYSSPNLSSLPSSSTSNADFISLQNLAALFQKKTGIENPLKYLLAQPPNSTGNTYTLQNLAFLLPSLIGTADSSIYSTHRQLLESTGTSNNNPFQISIPVLQSTTESFNSYPLQSLAPQVLSSKLTGNFNPLQILSLHSQMPKGTSNSYPLSILAPPQPSSKGIGNLNSLQNAALLSQNPIEPKDSHGKQIFPSQITKYVKDIEEYANKINVNYHSNKNPQYHHKTLKHMLYSKDNAAQYVSANNPTIVTPLESDNPRLVMFPNNWRQPNDVSTKNKYSNNEKLLQEKLNQLNNQHKPPELDLELETTTPDPADLYKNFNTNAFPSFKQYESEKLKMDSSSAKANSLHNYNQYLQLMKNLIYAQTNPGTGYLSNQQHPYSSKNYIPVSYEKNNALYNSNVNNFNQLAAQANIPNRQALYPNSYYYYNPNLAITNTAKDTPEKYGVQLKDLNRLFAVSNLDKLNSVSNKNGIIELTYKLSHPKPNIEPFYYVKYRLPYDIFLLNLKKSLIEKPNLRNKPHLLYKDLLNGSNITESSSDLKSLDKEEILRLVSTNGTLVTARVLDANDTTAKEQIKIVQKLNANMPLEDIVKNDANITKVSDLTSNIPLPNYLRARPNYLNDLQSKISLNRYYLNRYNAQTNPNYNQHAQYPTYLSNRMPNYLQNTPNYPYSYRLNSYPRYLG